MPLRKTALATAALVALLVITHTVWFRWLGQFLVQDQPPFQADAVLVLAGDWNGDRVLKGAELVKQGFAPVALISGPDYIYGINEGEMGIEFAVRKGYPRESFQLLTSSSFSTREEAASLAPALRARGIHKLMIVTNDFHTRRAGRFFRSRLDPDIEVRMIAVPDRFFSPGGWWHNREGEKVFFYEWSKTVAAVLGM